MRSFEESKKEQTNKLISKDKKKLKYSKYFMIEATLLTDLRG